MKSKLEPMKKRKKKTNQSRYKGCVRIICVARMSMQERIGVGREEKGISRKTFSVRVDTWNGFQFGEEIHSARRPVRRDFSAPSCHTQTHPLGSRIHQGGISISKSTPVVTALPFRSCSAVSSSFFKNATDRVTCRLNGLAL